MAHMSTREVHVRKIDLNQGELREFEDEVAVDEAVCIFINDEYFTTLISSPTMVREMAVGHLIGEGVIKSLDELVSLDVGPLKVYVELHNELDLSLFTKNRISLITTACGPPSAPLTAKQLDAMKVKSEISIEAKSIWNMIAELNRRGEVYRKTGGTHSAMICSLSGEELAFAEDVGRHNAVDKVIGKAVLDGTDLERCVLLCSGRQSSDIVLKAARSGIPVTASVTAPLESSIRIAQATGVTMVCFVRGRRMNVYTHDYRIKL